MGSAALPWILAGASAGASVLDAQAQRSAISEQNRQLTEMQKLEAANLNIKQRHAAEEARMERMRLAKQRREAVGKAEASAAGAGIVGNTASQIVNEILGEADLQLGLIDARELNTQQAQSAQTQSAISNLQMQKQDKPSAAAAGLLKAGMSGASAFYLGKGL